MRILFCTNSLGAKGGIERVTIVKANALAEIDGNVVGICFTDKGSYPQNIIHPISDKVKIYDLEVPFWDLTSMAALILKMPYKMLKLKKALLNTIDQFNPDIVISTGSYEKFVLASMNLKRLGITKIREYHFASIFRKFLGKQIFNKFSEYIDNRLIPLCFDKNYLLTQEDYENFKGKRKFDFMHNPCSFDESIDINIHQKENFAIFVGRLVDQKNVFGLLRIWNKCKKYHTSWKLLIIGDGPLKNSMNEMVSNLKLGDSVKFIGYTKNVVDYLNRSKILVSTSFYEGMPLNIIEGMHFGVVPVSYTFPYGPRDIINDGINGILVENGNEEEFAEKLMSLMNDEDKIHTMSIAASERAKDFDIDIIIDKWMHKYQELILEQKNK